ncbi:MAG: carboxypeptidase-like regulatory domain-containing protein, partial [Prevotella sp.]|nr:carboxypeptidase-like regulatory domain-containing protein [Prevotella sp.]
MNRFLLTFVFSLSVLAVAAQGMVRGKILEKQTDEAMQFVNVGVHDKGGKLVKGAITDEQGDFAIGGLPNGSYELRVTFVGYKSAVRSFDITDRSRRVSYTAIRLAEDQNVLQEVQVTGQRSQMRLEVDRKTFTVDQVLAAAGGSASDLLENIPSIEVTTDGEISLRGNSSVEV